MDAEVRSLLAEGAAALGIDLDEEALRRFAVYLDLLRKWGRSMNLTTVLEGREVVTTHFLDSLAGAPWIGEGEGGRLLDIGSGAGFPGLALKIAKPWLRVVLLDSVRKKVSFCRQVIRETGLAGASAEWGRAEELAAREGFPGSFRWVTTRAVGRAAELLALGLPFLEPRGRLLLYKGRPDEAELGELRESASREGLSVEVHRVAVPGLPAARAIVVVDRPAP